MPSQTIELPDWVACQLQPDERVLASLHDGAADLYATSARLLRFQGRRDCESVPYQSLRIAEKGLGPFMNACRALLIFLGLASTGVAIVFGGIGPTIHTGSSVLRTGMPAELAILFLAMGLIALLAGLAVADHQYEIAVIDPRGGLQRRWRLRMARWGSGDVRTLAGVLKEKTQ